MRMLYQTIQDRKSISGDSKACFVYIQEDYSTIFPQPTYPTETAAALGQQSYDFSAAWKLQG